MLSKLALGLAALAGQATAADTTACLSAPCEDSPNILFFVVDDLGFNDIGYNSELFSGATPTMQNLAESGVKLENFYVSPTCTPTRSQLMTGKYQIRMGMQDSVIHATEPRGVGLEHTFISETLRDQGYATYLVGKWHLGYHTTDYIPTSRGFDRFYGILTGGGSHYDHTSTAVFQPRGGFAPYKIVAWNLWEDDAAVTEDAQPSSGEQAEGGVHTTTLYTEQALAYIDDTPADTPFFMYLSYQAVHGPVQADAEYFDGSELAVRQADESGFFSSSSDLADGSSGAGLTSGCEAITAATNDDPAVDSGTRSKLCGMVAMIDEGLYRIKASLEASGRWDDTVVFFMSDNGGINAHGSSNAPLRGGKGDYWEGGLRVPAFVSGGYTARALGDAGAAAYASSDLWHVTDLYATSVGLAGGSSELLVGLDGVMQWDSLVAGEGAASPRSEILHNVNSELFATGGAVRVGDYKLVSRPPLEESEIYTYGLSVLADHDKDYDDLQTIILQKLYKSGDTEYLLFNAVENPTELESGDCAELEQCSNLYGMEGFEDIQQTMLDKWQFYADQAVESSEMWNDDGVLTHPDLFGGTWSPWRDVDGVPYASYSLQEVSLGAEAMSGGAFGDADVHMADGDSVDATAMDDLADGPAGALYARMRAATGRPSPASVLCMAVGVFAGAMGAVLTAQAKRRESYHAV